MATTSKEIVGFYDRLGARYDWFTAYEGHAKTRALELLDLQPGLRLLNVGVGTGKEHKVIEQRIAPTGIAVGLDLSQEMLKVTQRRTLSPLCQADARWLPFYSQSFDRLISTFTLDVIPTVELPGLLHDLWRVLKPGGRLVLVSLTEGVTLPSRAIVGLWKLAYKISPVTCGGCRPLQLAQLVDQAGFTNIQSQVIVQLGIPSEILTACREREP